MAGEIGVTEVAATQQDLVASIVQETLKEKSMLLDKVSDWSQFAVPGAKSVSAPRRSQMTADDKTENTDLTPQVITFSGDVIDLTLHKAIFAKLEDIAGLQANVNVEAEIIKEMAAELALQVDRNILVELRLASAAAPDHILDYNDTAGNVLALVDFAEARKLLRRQNIMPDNDWFAALSPEKEKDLLGIENFISAEKYGSREALLNGEVGRVFNFRILIHSELTALETIMWHKGAVGYATQMQPNFETDRDLKSTSTEYLLQNLYGVKVLDTGKRQVFFNGTGA